MFDPNSRYAHLEQVIYTAPDGRQTVHIRRRILPQGERIPELQVVYVSQGDRLDLITRTGRSAAFWQVCDANNAMNPFDLTAESEIGREVKIPVPQFRENR
jgi:hypothetical protein